MNGFVFRMPRVGLVAMGLVACSAAGEVPAMRGEDGAATADSANEGPLTLGVPLANTEGAGADADDAETDPGDVDRDDGNVGEPQSPIPGVEVSVGDPGITVTIDLPNGDVIRIDTTAGTCATSGTGIDIEGDLLIDIGTGLPMPLADADLHIEMAAGMPMLSGTANVAGSLLEGISCGCADDLIPAQVSLDTHATAEASGSVGSLAIALNLPMVDVTVDTGALPLGLGAVMLRDANVTIETDGEHRWLSVAGQVAGDATLWASTVPLQATSGLSVEATVSDGALLSVLAHGSINLQGDKLRCGITPLQAFTMPEARVLLDDSGLSLQATAQASAHPAFSITGSALVDGHFTPQDWSLTVCADVMTDVLAASVKLGQCLEMTASGAEMGCPHDDNGPCDGV
jgi:hypothetical protein